ncbi:MAG: hypothetical protein WKF73_22195 [Nocardioidaceae bacterium]
MTAVATPRGRKVHLAGVDTPEVECMLVPAIASHDDNLSRSVGKITFECHALAIRRHLRVDVLNTVAGIRQHAGAVTVR